MNEKRIFFMDDGVYGVMSKTRISDTLRLAIYEAYQGKCFYTGKPVSYIDFEVDHIIPESLVSEMENIKKRLGLGDDFCINSVENLVPSKPGINLRKNGELFSDNTLLLYLEQTKAKKKTVIALRDKYEKQRKLGNGYKAIDKMLANGSLSIEEVRDYVHMKIMEQWKDKKITLNDPICFEDGEMREVAVNENHKELLTRTLELFGNGQGVVLIGNNDESMEVHTLSEWKKYTEKGFCPNTNADIKMSGTFEFLDGLLTALDNAQMPKVSFVEGQSMKDLAGMLSASVLIDVEQELPEGTIGELVKGGKAEIIEQEDCANAVCIRYGGFLNTISEQFRADLTNDGIDNIFCYVWRNADGGSMGWGDTMILGCHSKDGVIEEEIQGQAIGEGDL